MKKITIRILLFYSTYQRGDAYTCKVAIHALSIHIDYITVLSQGRPFNKNVCRCFLFLCSLACLVAGSQAQSKQNTCTAQLYYRS